MNIADSIDSNPFILTDGGIETRIAYETSIRLDPDLSIFRLVYEQGGREFLKQIYRQYLVVGKDREVPVQIGTPTFRANPDRVRRLGFTKPKDVERVNMDCTQMHKQLRDELGNYGTKVFIAGVVGPKGDAYNPEEALSADEAEKYHAPQVNVFAEAGVDLLFAATFPAVSELLGLARAMAPTGLPYVLSPVIRADGALLDGTPIHELVKTLDESVSPRPAYYMVNCTHASICRKGLLHQKQLSQNVCRRVRGIKANSSRKRPEELESLDYLDTEEPEKFGREVSGLRDEFGFKVLGGCCGTDQRHLASLADRLLAR